MTGPIYIYSLSGGSEALLEEVSLAAVMILNGWNLHQLSGEKLVINDCFVWLVNVKLFPYTCSSPREPMVEDA